MHVMKRSLCLGLVLYLMTFAGVQVIAVLKMDFSNYWHDMGVIGLSLAMTVLCTYRLLKHQWFMLSGR
jgi:hypothetical protein